MSWVKEFNLAILEIDNNINSFVASQKFKEMQNNFRIFIDKINTNFLPMVEKISTNLPNLVNNIITNNQKHPDRIKKIQDLAKNGWFLSYGLATFNELNPILDKIDNDNQQQIDNLLVELHKQNFIEISEELTRINPDRKHLISEAIFAHNNQLFSLSTMSFIAQADGIIRERTGINLFNGLDRKSKDKILEEQKIYKSILDITKTDLTKFLSYMFPYFHFVNDFEIGNDLFLSEKKNSKNPRPENFDGLNRHQVMHGESLNYNTEINSYKAFSLLCSVSFLFLENLI